MENLEELGPEGVENNGNQFSPNGVGAHKADEEVKLTDELISKLDLYHADPYMRMKLARLCMYANGGESQAINTAYLSLRGEKDKVSFANIFKVFGSYIQQEFEQLKNNYLHVCKRDDYLLQYENLKGKCLVGIDKNLKLMLCFYKESTGTFHVGLEEGAKEVHPIAFFKHIDPSELINLINKEY